MKIYTVVWNNTDADSFAIGAFSTYELALEECRVFADSCEYKQNDIDKFSDDETRVYFENEYGEPSGFADISTLTLDEFTY